MERTIFRYDRRQFLLNLILLAVLSAMILVFLLPLGAIDIWGVTLITLMAALILILGISPFLTAHEIDRERIVLRQGIYFTGKVVLSDIDGVERILDGPRRTGVFFRTRESTLYVTTRRYDLISVRLKKPRRFGWALGKMVDRVVFDTEDNTRFLAVFESRTGLTPANRDQWF